MQLSASVKYDEYYKDIDKMASLLETDEPKSPELLNKLQSMLDSLAAKFQDDEGLGADRYALYHIQALIHCWNENYNEGRQWFEEAISLRGYAYESAQNYLRSIENIQQTSRAENKERINRRTFFMSWVVCLSGLLLSYILISSIIMLTYGPSFSESIADMTLYLVLLLGALFYFLNMAEKRLKDIGVSPSMVWLLLVPLLNLFVMLYLLIVPGDESENEYGQAPKKTYIWRGSR